MVGEEVTKYSAALLAIVLVGLFLRVYSITAQSLSPDEIFSFVIARKSLVQIVSGTASDVHPPLYYITLHYWIHLFGASEFAVRFLSVLFGVAAIPMIYLLGCSLFDKQVGLASAFILAFSSFNIQYSQEARMYSLMVLLALVSMYCFARLLKRQSYAISAGYVLFTALLLYTHVVALAVVIAQNIFIVLLVLLSREQTIGLRSWVTHQALVIALFIPWIGVEVNSSQRAIKPWLAPNTFITTLTDHAGSSLLLFLFAVLTIFSLFAIRRIRDTGSWKAPLNAFHRYSFDVRSDNVKQVGFLAVWLLAVNVVPLVVSTFSGYQLYLSKYVIAASVALYILVAAGIKNINSFAKLGALGVIVVLSVASVQAYYTTPTHQDSRAVMVYISNNAKSGDLVLVYPSENGVIFREYYQISGVTVVSFPSHSIYTDPWIKNPSANIDELRSEVAGHSHVWLIDFSQHNSQIDIVRNLALKSLNESYETTRVENFFRYTVYSFENQTV
ncbi:MAG: glycosyltransferase family 39 protein [Halobacteriota archaeon]